jgi:endonuclease YncB( thermonuclease family)
MQSLKLIFVFVMLIAQSIPAIADQIEGKVVSVADGDTVTVLDAGRVQHKIRLSGIDAPERSQAFGTRSREYLSSIVAGQQVVVETDKTDRFGRSVGKILLRGRDINLAMVAGGLAWHYKKYQREQSSSNAEQEARAHRVGLWRDDEPMAPWDWRSARRNR